MKKSMLISVSFFALMLCFSIPYWADPPGKDLPEAKKKQMEQEREHSKRYEERERESRKHKEEIRREESKHREEMRPEERKYHRDFSQYSGYRERPYDKHRHYGEYVHNGRRYDYQGHWRSWKEWDRYAKKHTDVYRNGKYYREGAHLMFRLCEPGTANCVFFSIGK
jgi:hypothetical protein